MMTTTVPLHTVPLLSPHRIVSFSGMFSIFLISSQLLIYLEVYQFSHLTLNPTSTNPTLSVKPNKSTSWSHTSSLDLPPLLVSSRPHPPPLSNCYGNVLLVGRSRNPVRGDLGCEGEMLDAFPVFLQLFLLDFLFFLVLPIEVPPVEGVTVRLVD